MGRYSINYLNRLKEESEEYQQFIVDSFLSYSKTITELSKILSIPASSISAFLKWKGINAKEHVQNKYSKVAEQAVKDHMSGMLLKDVINKYHISSDIIYNYMHKHNIQYSNNHGRKNWFDQHFFHDIDTEAKAYFLGYLFADGCISCVGKSYTRLCNITLDLSSKDRAILEKFLECINASGSTRIHDYIASENTYKAGPMSKVELSSVVMADDLISHGFTGLKKDRKDVPDMPNDMVRHFVRGYFDGDGCGTDITIQITGQLHFLNSLSRLISQHIQGIHSSITSYYQNKSVGDLCYNRKRDKQLLYNWLYESSSIYLQRKKNAVIKVLET